MRRELIAAAGTCALYLATWPVAIEPHAWTPPSAPELVSNTALSTVDRLGDGHVPGPEDVAVDETGRIYGGDEDGRIVRMASADADPELFCDTGGRPLGLAFDGAGNLLVADAERGLLRIDAQGNLTVLASGHRGIPFLFADDLDVAPDGTVYFSDASSRFDRDHYRADVFEHGPNGRLLAWEPATEMTRVVLDSLYFANGVAVSPDGSFVLVVETTKYRIMRHWLRGSRAHSTEIFADNLPGIPDGISCGGPDRYWVALFTTRNPLLDRLLPHPFLRRVLYRLPEFIQPQPKGYGFVLGLDGDGRTTHDLQDPEGRFAPITSVEESGAFLYLGSIEDDAIGRIAAPSKN